MKKRDQKRLSKILFALLARNPFEYGIVPSEGGWVRLKDIRWALSEQGVFRSLSVRGLQQFFELYQPENLEFREKSARVVPELQAEEINFFPPAEPPAKLYVAIRPKAHAHVLGKGLEPPKGSKWLVLWPEREKALNFGMRRDAEPLVGAVDTFLAQSQGALFFRGGDHIFLAQWLKPSWIDLPPLPEAKERNEERNKISNGGHGASDRTQRQMPGSYIPEMPPEWVFSQDKESARKHRARKKRMDKKRWRKEGKR